MKINKTRMICEAAIFIAMAEILSLIKLYEFPNGGSITLEMLPIILFAARYGCGYAPSGWDTLTKHLLRKGFEFKELEAAGLSREGKRGPMDRFHRRLLWPIRVSSGETIGFGARRPVAHELRRRRSPLEFRPGDRRVGGSSPFGADKPPLSGSFYICARCSDHEPRRCGRRSQR